MKLRVTFKTPDVAKDEIDEIPPHHWQRLEHLIAKFVKFVKYGEYVTIEFDTDNQTATVVPL